jgi:hypothetical protein
MCVVSAIYDYGQRIPPDWWNQQKLTKYRRLLDDAQRFDEETGQPDCHDINKGEFLQKIMDRLDRIEKKLDGRPANGATV